MPQLFLPADCAALLPVGSVTQRNVFWRITAIETDVDFSQLLDDTKAPSAQPHRGIGPARLGLPIAMWSPAWGPLLSARPVKTVDGNSVSLSNERIFLPAPKNSARETVPATPLEVVDLDALENGRLRYPDGRRVQVNAQTIPRLLTHGEALAILIAPRGGNAVAVTLQMMAYHAEIDSLAVLMSGQFQILLDDVVQAVQISSEDLQTLIRRKAVGIRIGKRAVRLRLSVEPEVSGAKIVRAHPPTLAGGAKDPGFSLQDWLGGKGKDGSVEPPYTQCVRELPRVEIVLATPIVQRWELLGYERGPLIGSVLLEPGAEATVEVFTWERLRLEREEQVAESFERNTELTALARATATVAIDTATELGTRFDFGGNASIPVEAVSGANLGASASTETQTAVNTSVNNGVERVAESTRKSAERFQSTHQVKIIQTTERGRETRSTRKIRNPNAGRTLEFLHFAINERHRVTTQVDAPARVVACIENPSFGAFDIGFIFAYEHVLKRALLSEDYLAGFAAARLLAAQDAFDNVLKKRDAKLEALRRAAQLAKEQLESSAPAAVATPVPGIPVTGIYQTARQIKDQLTEFLSIDLAAEGQVLADNINPLVGKDDKPSRTKVKKADARFSRWGFWTKFTMSYPGLDARAADFVALEFDGVNHASEEQVVAALQTLTDGLDDDWLAAVKMVAVAVIASTAASVLGGPIAGLLTPILIGLLLVSDDMGLPRAITRAKQELLGERAVQHGQAVAADLVATDAAAGGPDAGIAKEPPPRIMTDRELAEAEADFRKLVRHLQAHANYYQNAVWRAEDPADRYVRLDTMGLARYVENVLVGFVGNRAMYPLRLESLSKTARNVVVKVIGKQALAKKFPQLFAPVTDEIVLPTAAVHSEGYLGQCELLEPYIVERRKIDLDERRARAAREFELARQEALEAERFEARLLQNPPLLDDPTPTPSPRFDSNSSRADDDP